MQHDSRLKQPIFFLLVSLVGNEYNYGYAVHIHSA